MRLPGGRREPLALFMARVALPLLLLVLLVVFSLLRPATFFTLDNLGTVLTLQAVLGVLALGLLLPLIVGELDLSVAANLGLGVILVTGLTSQQRLPLVAAVVVAAVVCTLVGVVNGLLVTKVGINSFIVTIGMSTVIGGLISAYTQGNVFYDGIPPALVTIGQGRLLGVPLPVVYAVVLALAVWYVLSHTPVGRYLYAIGGSREAARLSGVPVRGLTLAAFAGAGLLAGVAGIVQAGILGSGNPTVGPPLLLPAYAAAFLGATAIQPGVFNVWGTIIAVVTIQVGTTGLALVGAPFWIEPVFTGLALIVAVATARYLRGEAL
ncbi:sugar ABC transporter permease [Microbispora rosea subsp. aerata]|nr:sugar ABC transporter permease [Microbispora rosea subsp. aerata]GIH55356.1 sugar ABC transporter permease [Microbispora rosea subsp. aerata]GLJ84553.1 sugar ABC transporter permease [Microbispora rosea subsp. aerata]